MKVDVKKAVLTAKNYWESLEGITGFKAKDLRLEEVELSEDKNYWFITLGFNIGQPMDLEKRSNSFDDVMISLSEKSLNQRDYKIFKINADTGEVESMKIRKP